MTDFAALRNVIQTGQVLVPGSEGFEESLMRWSETCIKPAAVVVKPASSSEVSETVKFAVAKKVPFTVKCGGHSTSGSSACEDGMIIDLGLMRKVSVDPQDQTVTFDGGCLWADVDKALWEHGLATVGGTVNDTGVGGLILGGGYGFLSPKYGLSIDVLLEAEVVTADGTIRTVSESENPDLFWAIRGAGQSFGVATRFKMRAFRQGNVYSGFVPLPRAALPVIVDFVNSMIESGDDNANMVWGPTHLPPNLDEGIMAIIFYNGTEEQGKAFFKPLIDAGLVNLASYKTWPEVNSQLGQSYWGNTPRKLHGGATFVPPLKLDDVQEACDKFFPFVQEHGIRDSTVIAWEIVPNGKVVSVDPTATAFAGRTNCYHICPLWQWKVPAKDDVIRQFNREIVKKLKESGVQNGVVQYNNYVGDQGDPEGAYGPNVKRLQELKTKYDPDNVFWKWHSFFPKKA